MIIICYTWGDDAEGASRWGNDDRNLPKGERLMPILSVVYDLTDYTAVMAVCIVLTVVLAGIIVAMAVLN